ncbi:hypothetical protein IQ07DRAFT_586844 [Pyrenochaeta sp. DS3sAY3a]|nr:hypothetical protein IQ07DRAFT_586844 [Pyrenochaeta sp. DS3sAY3a]
MSLEYPLSGEPPARKRQKLTHLPSPLPPQPDLNGLSTTGQTQTSWDHLLRYQELEDESIIDFGIEDDDQDESDSENDGDEDSAAEDNLREHEENGAPGSTQMPTLSTDEVVDIINERIEVYTESWPKHIEEEDYLVFSTKPAELWQKAEASGLREALVRKHEGNYLYYQHRLDELCEEITKVPGRSPTSIRQQCRNFQITVASMEFSNYLATIYKSSHASVIANFVENISHNDETEHTGLINHIDRIDRLSISESRDIENESQLPTIAPFNRPTQATQQRQRSPTTDSVIPASPVEEDMTAMDQALHLTSTEKHGDEPEHASISTVSRWHWMDLVATQDRKRVISKLVNNMDSQERESLRLRLRLVHRSDVFREISTCTRMLSGESHMGGVHPKDLAEIIILTKLFMSWWLCDNYILQEPSKLDLEQLSQCLNGGYSDLVTFYNYLSTIMTTTFNEDALMHPFRPSQAEIIVISDDDD